MCKLCSSALRVQVFSACNSASACSVPFSAFKVWIFCSTLCMHWLALFWEEASWFHSYWVDVIRSSWNSLLSEKACSNSIWHLRPDGIEGPASAISRGAREEASEFTIDTFSEDADRLSLSTLDQKKGLETAVVVFTDGSILEPDGGHKGSHVGGHGDEYTGLQYDPAEVF